MGPFGPISRPGFERLYVYDRLSAPRWPGASTCHRRRVRHNLDRHGLARLDQQAPSTGTPLRHLHVDEQLGVQEVVSRLGVGAGKVRADLARYRIPIRPPGRPVRHAS